MLLYLVYLSLNIIFSVVACRLHENVIHVHQEFQKRNKSFQVNRHAKISLDTSLPRVLHREIEIFCVLYEYRCIHFYYKILPTTSCVVESSPKAKFITRHIKVIMPFSPTTCNFIQICLVYPMAFFYYAKALKKFGYPKAS